MAKKITLNDQLEVLKHIHAEAQERVDMLVGQVSTLQKALDEARADAERTRDAIDALEGRPTLKTRLEEALLSAKAEAAPTSLDGPKSPIVPEKAGADELPPPEPGYHWVKDADGQNALVPDIVPEPLYVPGVGTGVPLPPVDGERDPNDFEDIEKDQF